MEWKIHEKKCLLRNPPMKATVTPLLDRDMTDGGQ